jgi:hypothetical protein
VCSEASAVMGAVVANFFLNWWNLKVSPVKSVRHIPWCVYYHAQVIRKRKSEVKHGMVSVHR